MSVDIAINPRTNDLLIDQGSMQIVTDDYEIVQRLRIRLFRISGEWFLNTQVGLAWYSQVMGALLGSKDSRRVSLLIRAEVLATEGVRRIIALNALLDKDRRRVLCYLKVETTSGNQYPLNLEFLNGNI
jgi:hypothetical protein